MGCGADTEANALLISLLAGKSFDIPEVDLDDPLFDIPPIDGDLFNDVTKLTNEDLTTRQIDGSGTFDYLMSGFAAHLKGEYDNDRITGDDYTKAFIALTGGAMQNATAFLLGRDQAYWSAITAQLQAQAAQVAVVTARIGLETAKVQLQAVRFEALNQEATYALTKMKLATEDMNYCVGKFNLEKILPEQYEAARAQTLDTRSDGNPVAGSVGKQKQLYDQQISSYKRDAESKLAKLYVDAWITQKTIDEGILPPDQFTNAEINEVLVNLRTNNEMGS